MSRPSDAAGRSWLPGEVLPTRCECVNQLKESIHELITSMQTNILNEMNEMHATKSSVTINKGDQKRSGYCSFTCISGKYTERRDRFSYSKEL